MKHEEMTRRVLETLHRDVRRQRGGIGALEKQIGRSTGYLSKVSRGTWPMPLDVLARALDACGVEPGSFFGRAFDVAAGPRDYLAELAAEHGASASAPVPSPGRQRGGAVPEAYLAHLDLLRESRPREAVRLGRAFLADVVPGVEDSRRPALRCRALAVLGSSYRLVPGELGRAASCLGEALDLAREDGDLAAIYLRAAYVLSDRGWPQRAADALRWALEALPGEPAPDRLASGRVLLGRGIARGYAGDYGGAEKLLRRALRRLPHGTREREAAFHHLILAAVADGNPAGADDWLDEAARALGTAGNRGTRLLWQRGRILLARGRSAAAGRVLREVMARYARDGDPEGALAVPDLLRTAGRAAQRRELATEHLRTLRAYEGRSARILADLARAALDGPLTAGDVETAASRIQRYPLTRAV